MPIRRDVPPLVSTVGRQVTHWRKKFGYSQRRLAEEVTALGVPLTTPMVASMETERRDSIGVAEILAIAYVLGVPPILLLLPLGREDRVEIVPGLPAHPDLARKWLTGAEPPFALPGGTDAGGVVLSDRVDQWRQAAAAIRLYDRFDAAQDRDDLDGLFAALRDMGAAGVRPPALMARLVEALRERDVSRELPDLRAIADTTGDG